MNKPVRDVVEVERADSQHDMVVDKDFFDKIVLEVSKMLLIIKNAPTTEVDFNYLIGTTDRSIRRKYLRNVVKPALEAELIEHTIPDKPTSRYQKYRLTTKASQLLKIVEVNT